MVRRTKIIRDEMTVARRSASSFGLSAAPIRKINSFEDFNTFIRSSIALAGMESNSEEIILTENARLF
jgi:hypothetical protein